MDFLNDVLQFFNDVSGFMHSGVYDFFTKLFAQFIIWFQVAYIKVKIYGVTFAYGIAQQILAQLQISTYLDSAFSSLDPTLSSALSFFYVPESINIILSAYTTRFVLDFLGL